MLEILANNHSVGKYLRGRAAAFYLISLYKGVKKTTTLHFSVTLLAFTVLLDKIEIF